MPFWEKRGIISREWGEDAMEYNDIYDKDRHRTGRVHQRGRPWRPGEYGLVVCSWIIDGQGRVLLTQRAPEKSYPGTWENSGGAAQAGETSRQAIAREVFEETGILAEQNAFELLDSRLDGDAFFDYYCLKRSVPIEEIVLLPGETVDAKWVTFDEIHQMIRRGEICRVIANQYLRQEKALLERQDKVM